VFFGGFIPKCIYPRVTGILIPISTHPIVHYTEGGGGIHCTISDTIITGIFWEITKIQNNIPYRFDSVNFNNLLV
jgi:hypothetical protein